MGFLNPYYYIHDLNAIGFIIMEMSILYIIVILDRLLLLELYHHALYTYIGSQRSSALAILYYNL